MRAQRFFTAGAELTGVGRGKRARYSAPLSCRTRRSVVPYPGGRVVT